jgi:hypothetical protein
MQTEEISIFRIIRPLLTNGITMISREERFIIAKSNV